MKRSRLITAGIVLLAAFVSCICSLIERISLATSLKRLAITIGIFIVIAFIIEIIIEWNFKPEEEEEETENPEGEESEENAVENIDTEAGDSIIDGNR